MGGPRRPFPARVPRELEQVKVLYGMTGHGFRTLARTILEEVLHVPGHIIELQFGHTVKDPELGWRRLSKM